ncbi:MAG: FAD binding domain-containing protein [Frankia sp.]|nr:FAD binding domain-containing protein [Frankia sp.]
MKPAPFDYHRPDSLDEAAALLAELGDGAKVLAGGQSLIPMLALRLACFDHLVDISRIDALRGVERRDGTLWVGATTTESAIGADPAVAAAVPLLARATPLIGHAQIRNRGTFGGSVAHADPAAEYPAVVLALDAELAACSAAGGQRVIPAAQFFTGLWSTALEPEELLVGARFPVWSGRCGFAIEEFARRSGDFAIAGAAVAVELDDGEDRVRRCAIALLGMGPTPVRAAGAEAAVTGRPLAELEPADVGATAVAGLADVPSDLHGPQSYRRRVGAVMTARAFAAATAEAAARPASAGAGNEAATSG